MEEKHLTFAFTHPTDSNLQIDVETDFDAFEIVGNYGGNYSLEDFTAYLNTNNVPHKAVDRARRPTRN